MDTQKLNKIFSLAAFILFVFLIFEFTGLRENFSLPFLRSSIEAHLILGSLLFIAMFAIGNIIQIPGWIFLAAAVLALGKVSGGLVTYLAANISCLLTYLLVEFLGKDALRGLTNPLALKLFSGLDKYPIRTVFALRLFFQTLPIVNYGLALSGVKFKQYFIGTLIGLPLPLFLYCWFFDYLAQNLFHIAS